MKICMLNVKHKLLLLQLAVMLQESKLLWLLTDIHIYVIYFLMTEFQRVYKYKCLYTVGVKLHNVSVWY